MWFEITKMLIVVQKINFIVLFILIFGTFSFRLARLQLNTFRSLEEVANSLTTWVAAGSTNMAAALRLAGDVMFTAVNGDRPDVPNYVVLITDGRSDNRTATVAAAERLRAAGVVVVVVGVGDSVDLVELSLVASPPTSSTVLPSAPRPGGRIDDRVLEAVVNIVCQNAEAGCAVTLITSSSQWLK